MQTILNTDIIIIGAGPAGLFAIFQAGMLGMRTHVIDSLEMIGGQCSTLYPEKPIYDIPAYPQILAQNLIDNLMEQARPFAPIFHLNQQVNRLENFEDRFCVTTSANTKISAKVIIIAAGCGSFGPNKPPLKNIEQYEQTSVFYNVRRREDFIDKKIVIAGGGDSAVDWAISLSEIAKKIYVVHRRDKFRALPENVRKLHQLNEEGKIELVIGYQLDQLIGNDSILDAVQVRDLHGNTKLLEASILLPFFGLTQNLGPIADWGLNLSMHHITTSFPYFETNIKNIYAVGDISSYPGKLKLILSGFAEVASAIHHAYARVFDGKALHFEYSTSKGTPRGA